MSRLDAAHAEMIAAGEDPAAPARFWERLVAAELFLLLAAEPAPDRAEPLILATGDGPVALAFDSEARLAEFLDAPAPWAALPGRAVVRLLAGQGVALGLNLGVAPSSILLPAAAVDWAAAALGDAPEAAEDAPGTALPPRLPPAAVAALDARLAALGPAFGRAVLAALRYRTGREADILALTGVAPEREAGIAAALSEAVRLTAEAGAPFDIAFLPEDDPVLAALARVGIAFSPAPAHAPAPAPAARPAPDRPPRLR